jgi:hypothetical protein
MVKLVMSAGMLKKLVTFFDGYEDDQIKCKHIESKGIRATFECETEMTADQAASYCKALFKKTPEGPALYFSIQPDGAF